MQHIKYCSHDWLSRSYKICLQHFVRVADDIWLTGLGVGYFYLRRKNGSNKISGGNQVGSDTFQNGSDVIRYIRPLFQAIHGGWKLSRLNNLERGQKYCLTWSKYFRFSRKGVNKNVLALSRLNNLERGQKLSLTCETRDFKIFSFFTQGGSKKNPSSERVFKKILRQFEFDHPSSTGS